MGASFVAFLTGLPTAFTRVRLKDALFFHAYFVSLFENGRSGNSEILGLISDCGKQRCKYDAPTWKLEIGKGVSAAIARNRSLKPKGTERLRRAESPKAEAPIGLCHPLGKGILEDGASMAAESGLSSHSDRTGQNYQVPPQRIQF